MSLEPRVDVLLPASKMLRPSSMTLMRAPSSMPESDSYVVATRMVSFSSMPTSGPVVVDGSVALPPPEAVVQAPRELPPPGAVYQPFKWQGYDPMQHYVRVCKRKYGPGCRPWLLNMRDIVLQSMRTDIVIEGQAVTVAVSQTYTNQGNKPLEVVFSMGLGPMAVTGLECERDGVVVAGEIKPSAKARDDYDDSISMGHTASLGEYNSEKRTFEMSLGNLTMGSTLTVRIKLTATLEGDKESLWFGLPNDFFPRPGGHRLHTTVKASFPDGIDTMTVTQGQSTWLADASSAYESSESVGAEGVFAVRIAPKKKFEPSVLLEENGASRALALTFFPSWDHLDKDLFTPYVEVVFLVDRSGSMGQGFGPSRGGRMNKARETLTLFLSSLPQNCRFQIIGFGGRYEKLFSDGPRLYTPATLQMAQGHVKAMQADLGGTDLLAPLTEVLAKPPLPDYPRHVFVLTDGNVNNRDDTIAHVLRRRGATVIHAVGLGNGADAALVQGVAHAGNGLSDMIADNSDMRGVVIRQLSRALEPTLRKVAVEFVNCKAEHVAPTLLPPLVSGDRLSVFALNVELQEGAAVRLTGIAPDESSFECVLPLSGAAKTTGKAVHLAAAHAVVRELEAQPVNGSAKTIEALGLKYSFVTSKTSFGAMFENEKLPEGEMVAVDVPTLGDKGPPVFFVRLPPPKALATPAGRQSGRRKSMDAREQPQQFLQTASSRSSSVSKPLGGMEKMKKKSSESAPRRRLSSESHDLEASDGAAIHKSDLLFDSADYGMGGPAPPRSAMSAPPPPPPGAPPLAPPSLLYLGKAPEDDDSDEESEREETVPLSAMRCEAEGMGGFGMDRASSPKGGRGGAPPRPSGASPKAPATSARAPPGSTSAVSAAPPAGGSSGAGANDAVMRAAAGQDATGFWTLAAAVTLTGIKAADPTKSSNSALFGTALVIEWLAAKHAGQEAEWKLLVQKARTWLKKQQIALKLQGTDFLALARALI